MRYWFTTHTASDLIHLQPMIWTPIASSEKVSPGQYLISHIDMISENCGASQEQFVDLEFRGNWLIAITGIS
jgi:hypothetical protein